MSEEYVLLAICDGEILALEEMLELEYARKWIGEGIAFKVRSGSIVAPAAGRIRSLPEGLKSIGLVLDNGLQIELHVGHLIQREKLGFVLQCTEDQLVQAGESLARFDYQRGMDLTVPMLVRRHCDFGEVRFHNLLQSEIKKGETIVMRYTAQ